MSVDADRSGLAAGADLLRQLHHLRRPLVLPNVWDAATARLVAAAGFPAVATSSSAVAAARGYVDNDTMPPDEAFDAVACVVRAVEVPVTADVESAYGLSPIQLAERLIDAGAAGCNVEDTDHHSEDDLMDMQQQADFIAGLKRAARAFGVDLVVNARVDAFQFCEDHREAVDEAVRRGRAYSAAGADCVFPMRLADEALIAQFVASVGAPVNILARGAPQISRLAELGVARVSFGGALMAVALGAVRAEVESLAAEAL